MLFPMTVYDYVKTLFAYWLSRSYWTCHPSNMKVIKYQAGLFVFKLKKYLAVNEIKNGPKLTTNLVQVFPMIVFFLFV